MLDFRLSS